ACSVRSHGSRVWLIDCVPHQCAQSAGRAPSRSEVALGRAMNAAALLGRGRAGLDRLIRGCRPPGLLAATYVDQYPGGETVRLVCASEYRKPECTAIAAAFGTVWIARLVFLRSCAGGGVLAVDFAPLAPSLFAVLRAGDRPRLAAYSLPSIDATCGGTRSRYGRPTPSAA